MSKQQSKKQNKQPNGQPIKPSQKNTKSVFQIDEAPGRFRANIKVVGVGGGGCNAVKNMYESGLSGVEFIAANTDLQVLEELDLSDKIQLGAELTKGLGAGANPEIGRRSAIESCSAIANTLESADMVFITAGMGGGTGTGAAGVIAGIAKKQGALTVGVVTRPFFFEGRRRARHAEMGIQFLKEHVDTLIVIPNQKLFKAVDENTSLYTAFETVDDILLKAVKSISDLVNKRGLINLDFSDIKTIMSEKGLALIGTGQAQGENRALTAGHIAVSSPLLEDSSFKGARGVIINITGGSDLSLAEVNQTAEIITAEAHPDAEIIFGAVVDQSESSGQVQVTVIATGFTGGEDNTAYKPLSSSGSKSAAPSEAGPSWPQNKASLPKEALIEKPQSCGQEKSQTPLAHSSLNDPYNRLNNKQLSMPLQTQKDTLPPAGKSSRLPFESHKKRTFLMELFKKPADKEG